MKKALIITTISGFVPQFEMNHVRLLQDMGYEVHYASNFERPVYEYDKDIFRKQKIITHHFTIEKSPIHFFRNYRALMELGELLRAERFDLIHCHNPMGGVLGRLAGQWFSPKTVMIYTAHGFHFYRKGPWKNWILYYPVERLLAHVTDFLITINNEDYERALHFSLREGGSVWKIPGVGLDVKRFVPESGEKQERKRMLGFPERSFLLLSVGELNRNKNHSAVIRALGILQEKDIYYGICGRGPYRAKLEKLIAREGLSGHVKLLGYRKDIDRVLQAADCFIFPSKREGFGMAAVEAMAAGKAMITSDCRGTREYMENHITGIVCKRNVPRSYAIAIEQMKNSSILRKKTEKICRKKALQFGIEETKHVMRQIYELASRGR